MTWNYRIIRYQESAGYGLHEVYYSDTGEPRSRTLNPTGFACDDAEGAAGIIESLEMALADARKHPVLDDSEIKATRG